MATTFNVFYLPNNLVISGVSGVSIIVSHISNIEPSLFILICNVLLLILSIASLGFRSSIKTIIGSAFYTLFIYITKDINSVLNIEFGELLMYVLVGGALFGFGTALTFKYGYSTGGTDVLTLIVNKYSSIPLAKARAIIYSIIIISGGFTFGWSMIIYAVIALYIESIVMDKVLLGIVGSKVFYIGTDKIKEVQDYIMNDMHMGVTLLEAKGGKTNKTKYIIMTTIPSTKYGEVKTKVKMIDEDAFIMVSNCYDVLGGKR